MPQRPGASHLGDNLPICQQTQYGAKILRFRDDKGGEYTSGKLDDHLKAHGIAREHTVRATPQQNGAAERLNKTLSEGVIAILTEAHLPASWWGEALAHYVRILNASPTSALAGKTVESGSSGGSDTLRVNAGERSTSDEDLSAACPQAYLYSTETDKVRTGQHAHVKAK